MDVFETETELRIIMELCTGGDVFDRVLELAERQYTAGIKKKEGPPCYSERDAAILIFKALEAVDYIHTVHNIIHRDIKPEVRMSRERRSCGSHVARMQNSH